MRLSTMYTIQQITHILTQDTIGSFITPILQSLNISFFLETRGPLPFGVLIYNEFTIPLFLYT